MKKIFIYHIYARACVNNDFVHTGSIGHIGQARVLRYKRFSFIYLWFEIGDKLSQKVNYKRQKTQANQEESKISSTTFSSL